MIYEVNRHFPTLTFLFGGFALHTIKRLPDCPQTPGTRNQETSSGLSSAASTTFHKSFYLSSFHMPHLTKEAVVLWGLADVCLFLSRLVGHLSWRVARQSPLFSRGLTDIIQNPPPPEYRCGLSGWHRLLSRGNYRAWQLPNPGFSFWVVTGTSAMANASDSSSTYRVESAV